MLTALPQLMTSADLQRARQGLPTHRATAALGGAPEGRVVARALPLPPPPPPPPSRTTRLPRLTRPSVPRTGQDAMRGAAHGKHAGQRE